MPAQFMSGEYSYDGEYRNGKKDGKGKEVLPCGTSYEGEWKNGKKHSEGVEELSDKTRFEGEF